jgi:hypothetical protein
VFARVRWFCVRNVEVVGSSPITSTPETAGQPNPRRSLLGAALLLHHPCTKSVLERGADPGVDAGQDVAVDVARRPNGRMAQSGFDGLWVGAGLDPNGVSRPACLLRMLRGAGGRTSGSASTITSAAFPSSRRRMPRLARSSAATAAAMTW